MHVKLSIYFHQHLLPATWHCLTRDLANFVGSLRILQTASCQWHGHGDWILNKAGCHFENVKQKRRAEQRGAKRLTRGLHNYRCSFRLGFYSYTTWKTIVFVHFKQVCLPLSLLRVFLFTLLSWVVLDR